MKTKRSLYHKAVRLRKRGLSYNEIRKHVPVAKSTLSLWLKDVPLAPEHRERLYTKQIAILSRGAPSQKERRKREVDEIINAAMDEVSLPISSDAYKLFGAALYWAEGNKRTNFQITNSDPLLILFIVQWLKTIFNIDATALKAWLNIYPQQDEEEIKNFWSDLTGIPLSHFGKSFIKPISKGFKKNDLYYGTIKIYVPKGTDLRHKVYGWIKKILQNVHSEVLLTERKWEPLKRSRPVNVPEKPL